MFDAEVRVRDIGCSSALSITGVAPGCWLAGFWGSLRSESGIGPPSLKTYPGIGILIVTDDSQPQRRYAERIGAIRLHPPTQTKRAAERDDVLNRNSHTSHDCWEESNDGNAEKKTFKGNDSKRRSTQKFRHRTQVKSGFYCHISKMTSIRLLFLASSYEPSYSCRP